MKQAKEMFDDQAKVVAEKQAAYNAWLVEPSEEDPDKFNIMLP